jgi:hypothetical protein
VRQLFAEAVLHVRPLGVEAVGRHRRRRHADADAPLGARLELDAPADRPAVDLARLREEDVRRLRPVGVDEGEPLRRLELRLGRLRQGMRALRVAEREVPVLDGEQVGEVGADLHPHEKRDALGRLVLHDDAVLKPVADEALARDEQRVLRQRLRGAVPKVERGREVLDLPGREQERALAVDRQTQLREEADVLGEEPARLLDADVAEVVADAEGRAFEDRERHSLLRRMRPPEDCASALTTSSSTFTCGGRVSAKTMQSAISDGAIASTPR